jgi:N-acetylmuramoyl-L-alanine amidase
VSTKPFTTIGAYRGHIHKPSLTTHNVGCGDLGICPSKSKKPVLGRGFVKSVLPHQESVDCYHRAMTDLPAPGGRIRSFSRRDVLKVAGVAPAILGAATVGSPRAAAGLAGSSVFLDPGHNAVNDASINQQVTNGRGGTKPCQTSGTATDDGYSEHAFNWAVVGLINASLNQLGVRTQLSRDSDSAVGPCIDQRAAQANAMRPDAIVSIHADGGPASGSGFHVNYSSPPLNEAQSGPAMQLAHTMRDALVQAGYHPATYIGSDGLYGRADLAGLNLAEYPAVLVELGNMKNADDAARMQSADGRAQYAAAVTNGIVAFLNAKPATG